MGPSKRPDSTVSVVSGNLFYSAQPVGVRNGIDYGATGEVRRVGGLDLSTFAYFLKRAGGTRFGLVVCVLGFAAYGLMATTDLWLASWVQNDDQFGGTYSDTERAIGYIAFSLAQAVLVLSLSTWDAFSVNRACKAIHADSIVRKIER